MPSDRDSRGHFSIQVLILEWSITAQGAKNVGGTGGAVMKEI